MFRKETISICRQIVDLEHECFIQKYQPQQEEEEDDHKNKGNFIFFDLKCVQETGFHIPNFCEAHRACEICIHEPIFCHCPHCSKIPGGREKIFRGPNTLTDFAQWILDPTDETWGQEDIECYGDYHRYATVMAHNFSGYYAKCLLKYYTEQGYERPKVTLNGAKFIYMQVGQVRFIDLMSYLCMTLSRMPKTLGITEMAKGYFPNFFNSEANQRAVLPHLPDDQYYDPDKMRTEQREAFYAWYQTYASDPFEFLEEMLTYCRSDVDILLCKILRTVHGIRSNRSFE